jgi:hypothetical protein
MANMRRRLGEIAMNGFTEWKDLVDRYRLASEDVGARLKIVSEKLSANKPIGSELGRLSEARDWLRQVDGTLNRFIGRRK